ncbi:hypothetical protein [Arthrobacter wenxiniae]|jgi:hypothetical protein|uniref:Uncharacterized protein n=1 Tax=Arthrobacter wenxiniae TaxID=2713570 RepID=A0A7Y7IJN0_9MICC|nr:hypothetical protein [Arthrobacter wenxiniae]NVM96537.1 hypothetical protein [Arthrobacter wenxiniae]
MLTLRQDTDGFIHMSRHFPQKMAISIIFTDGSTGEYSGARLNGLYDQALSAYRLGNNLDAKGFDRVPAKVHRRNAVGLVPVSAGMGG